MRLSLCLFLLGLALLYLCIETSAEDAKAAPPKSTQQATNAKKSTSSTNKKTATNSNTPSSKKTTAAGKKSSNDKKRQKLEWKDFTGGIAESKKTGKYLLLIIYESKDGWSNKLRQEILSSRPFAKESNNFVIARTTPALLQEDIATYFNEVTTPHLYN